MIIEIQEPETITEINISEETKTELKNLFFEEGQVIVHCLFPAMREEYLIRIWQTTFLIDKNSSHKSKLLHAEGITVFPYWTPVEPNRPKKFTLFFSRLPSSCTQFDLLEEIPQSGGFFVNGITRNSSDVYNVNLH
jgi:hypothetical protein